MESIYLDHNSTTPMLPEVWEAMRPFALEQYANPGSAHHLGRKARKAWEDCKQIVASCLGTSPGNVLFTSGATEANNLAIHSLSQNRPGKIITSPLEHPSILEPGEASGREVTFLPVSKDGPIDLGEFQPFPNATSFITLQYANHETGQLQPVKELVQQAKGIPIHCDATQAVGKVAIHFDQLGVASLSASGHKNFGPKGVGVLLTRPEVPIHALQKGGQQQSGKRAGTEALPLAVGFSTALKLACEQMAQRQAHVKALTNRFLELLHQQASPVYINGDRKRLPHVLNLSFPGCDFQVLLMRLDLAGIACSSGATCSSGSQLASPVLKAMHLENERVLSAIRFSFGFHQPMQLIEEAAQRVAHQVLSLRQLLA